MSQYILVKKRDFGNNITEMWLYLGKILSSKTTIKIIINKMNEPSLPGQLKQMLKKSPQDSGNW